MNIELTPMDYYFFRPRLYTIQFVFEYSGRIDSEQLIFHINKATDILIVPKCRLNIIDKNTICLRENTIQAITSVCELEEQPQLNSIDSLDRLIDPVYNIENQPLYKFKINYYQDKTYLGVSFSHILGDGSSFFMFLKSISDFSLGISNPQSLGVERDLVKVQRCNEGNNLFEKTGYIIEPNFNVPIANLELTLISFEELRLVKKELEERSQKRFSYNTILMGMLVKKYHLNIPLTKDGKIIVRCPVDYRGLHPKIPKDYFGNAILDAVVSLDPTEVDHMSLEGIADKIQMSIKHINVDSIDQSLGVLDEIRKNHDVDIFQHVACPGLLVSNISKLPFHNLNFGCGEPISIHPASRIPNLAVIMAHSQGFQIRFQKVVS